MLTHWDFILFGTVQGVFLRRTIAHHAKQLGLSGFVRNEKDGTVYIEAEGEKEKLELLKQWLKSGAGGGPHSIKEVEITEGHYKAQQGFEIRD
jgi:acylphosphatase